MKKLFIGIPALVFLIGISSITAVSQKKQVWVAPKSGSSAWHMVGVMAEIWVVSGIGMASLLDYVEQLRAENPAWVSSVNEAFGEVTVVVPAESIVDACWALKSKHGFDMLADLCGADRGPEEDPRFEVNYHLFSTTHFNRLRLKALLSEDDPKVGSVTSIWKTADWHERETYDLLGVVFEGHPDLRRILLPSDFDGHALRKDYPLRGYEPYSMN